MQQYDPKQHSVNTLEKKVVPARMHHVFYKTRQFQHMKEWHAAVLNADVIFDSGTIAFLTFDQENHRVAILSDSSYTEKAEQDEGIEHIGYVYETLDDLLATYERLKAIGILPYWTINHGPSISFYYADPDKNHLELQVDTFKTREEALDFIEKHFPTNPIGVNVDVEKLTVAYRNGASFEEIAERAYQGEFL